MTHVFARARARDWEAAPDVGQNLRASARQSSSMHLNYISLLGVIYWMIFLADVLTELQVLVHSDLHNKKI